mmetsp:Transcript_477/g.1056  ORF Transcript_477/g.1056 Transcript_477/m.1056 type:complete len:302 (+) Transcript_477:211-1116(+)
MDCENDDQYISLLKVVEQNKCIPEFQASFLTRTLICHLVKLHDLGQPHGRLGLDNVYIQTMGQNRGSMHVGTELENSSPCRRERSCCCVPETHRASSCSPSSDAWSVGCLLIQMLTGRVCCTRGSGDCIGLLYDVDRSSPLMPLGVSFACIDFLLQCLCSNPCERPSLSELFSHEYLMCRDASCILDLCSRIDDIPLLVKEASSSKPSFAPAIPRLRFCRSSLDAADWDEAPCMRSRNRSEDSVAEKVLCNCHSKACRLLPEESSRTTSESHRKRTSETDRSAASTKRRVLLEEDRNAACT